jgi:hypothetical protein
LLFIAAETADGQRSTSICTTRPQTTLDEITATQLVHPEDGLISFRLSRRRSQPVHSVRSASADCALYVAGFNFRLQFVAFAQIGKRSEPFTTAKDPFGVRLIVMDIQQRSTPDQALPRLRCLSSFVQNPLNRMRLKIESDSKGVRDLGIRCDLITFICHGPHFRHHLNSCTDCYLSL